MKPNTSATFRNRKYVTAMMASSSDCCKVRYSAVFLGIAAFPSLTPLIPSPVTRFRRDLNQFRLNLMRFPSMITPTPESGLIERC